jgi:hypothetical protein
MQLLTDSLRKELPPLYASENVSDPTVVCKFFLPGTGWTWYVIEFDGDDTFFGYVIGLECELGYFSLQELTQAQGPLGLRVERDCYFQKQPLSKVRTLHERRDQH